MLYLPSYAGALRCIGQELQRYNIDLFELKSHPNEFRLQCGDPDPPYTGLIEMVFSKEKIQVIHRAGRAQRGRSTGEIRFDSIVETLRAVGNISTKRAAPYDGLATAILRPTRLFSLSTKPELAKLSWKP